MLNKEKILEYISKNDVIVIPDITREFNISFYLAKKELDNLTIDRRLKRISKGTYYIYRKV